MRFAPLALLLLAASPASAEKITHGPILGRISSDGVGVWARTERPGAFWVELGTSPERLNHKTKRVKTDLADDNTGWIHIADLEPNTKYYYRVQSIDGPGPGGSFRTLPSESETRHRELNPRGLYNFSFEFACGNNQNEGHSIGPELPTFKTMLRELRGKVHFSILNGDWLYERKREFSPDQWRRQVGAKQSATPRIVELAPTITGVWENYKSFLEEGEPLARWHRNVPTFFTFDDHEILNDVWGAGTPGRRNRRAVFRDTGVRAWYDYLGWSNPVPFDQEAHFGRTRLTEGSDVLHDPDADFQKLDLSQMSNLHVHWGTKTAGVNDNSLDGVGGDVNAGTYRIEKVIDRHRLKVSPAFRGDSTQSYSIGRRSYYKMQFSNCEYFMLDTRSHRQMHDVTNPGKKGLSILGPRQKKWLLDGLKNSDADFLFIVSSVNLMIPHVGGGKVVAENKDEAWTVFLDERREVLTAAEKTGRPVFFLTGDLHNSFVIKISDNVWEMASGPHNSNNHWFTDEGGRPVNGPFENGGRKVDIRWSTHFNNDIPRSELQHPTYCVVQVNNVYNNPKQVGGTRWIAFRRPHVIFKYFNGRTGDLLYAESIHSTRTSK